MLVVAHAATATEQLACGLIVLAVEQSGQSLMRRVGSVDVAGPATAQEFGIPVGTIDAVASQVMASSSVLEARVESDRRMIIRGPRISPGRAVRL
jgi:hypothetical protein